MPLPTPTTALGSLTGVGLSHDGGKHFTDLTGLPNNNTDQQWSGDPSIASMGDGSHFVVSSLYYPSARACIDGLPAYGTVAVSVAAVNSAGIGARFTAPIPVALPGDLCTLDTPDQPLGLSTLDKDWVSYDPASRTLAVSYTRFYFPPPFICDPNGCTQDPGGHSGNGQIEVAHTTMPSNPMALSAAAFRTPVSVWPEEATCPDGTPSSEQSRCGAVNQGAYVAVGAGAPMSPGNATSTAICQVTATRRCICTPQSSRFTRAAQRSAVQDGGSSSVAAKPTATAPAE